MLRSLVVLSALNVALTAGVHVLPIAYLGATGPVDALVASLIVPNVITAIGAVVITYVLVPPLSTATPGRRGGILRRGHLAASKYLAAPALVLWATASLWVPLTIPGFTSDLAATTVALTRVTIPAAVIGIFGMILSADRQARLQLVENATAALIAAAGAFLVAVLLIARIGVWAIPVSLLVRSSLQVALLVLSGPREPPVVAESFRVSLEKRAAPLLMSASVSKFEPLVDRALLSAGPTGSLALYNLAQQAYGACSQVVANGMLAHLLPRLSRVSGNDEAARRYTLVRRELIRLTIAAVGITVLLLLALEVPRWIPATRVVAEGAAASVLRGLLVTLFGMWLFGLHGIVLSSYFYSKGDTVTPSWIGVIGFATGVLLKVLGFREFGIQGLAVATSCYLGLNAAAMLAFVIRDRAAAGTHEEGRRS